MMHRAHFKSGLAAACFISSQALWAQDALSVDPSLFQAPLLPESHAADAPSSPEKASGFIGGLRLELSQQNANLRASGQVAPASQGQEIALDIRKEWALMPDTRFNLSTRLEARHNNLGDGQSVALREIYLSHAASGTAFVDAGRINARFGVASGLNPTDFFKRGALVNQTSRNPATLRENRLGTVMVRGQWLYEAGSLTAIAVPAIHEPTPQHNAAPQWGKTNAEQAALLRWAPQLSEATSLDVIAYARAHDAPTLGGNLTHVIGTSLVTYLEGAVGEKRQAVAGLTWTLPQGANLTIERHYAADALSPKQWREWQGLMNTPQASVLGALRQERAAKQEPLTRDAWFLRFSADDVLEIENLDFAALSRVNATDFSTLTQLEWHWHVNDHHTLSVVIGANTGSRLSEMGSLAARRFGQLTWTLYP